MKRYYIENNSDHDTELTIAKLALLGSALSSLGDAISTVAAALDLKGIIKSSSQQKQINQQQEIELLQKQIDELKKMMKSIK